MSKKKATEIFVPDIGDYADIPVIEISVSAGDTVAEGDTLIVLESDKATLDIPAEAAGTVDEIKVNENELLREGSLILTMVVEQDSNIRPQQTEDQLSEEEAITVASESSEDNLPIEPPQPQQRNVALPVTAATNAAVLSVNSATPPHASPSVRRFARELGVAVTEVAGTGPKKRITAKDVCAFVKLKMTTPTGVTTQLSSTLAALPDWPKIDFARYGDIERLPLSRINKISGPALSRNAMIIPHVTTFDKSDVTEIENFRQILNTEAGLQDAKITLLAFAVKAVVTALKLYPKFNSSLDGDELVFKHYWNIGVAANTPDGLVVPVVKNADQKGLREIANEMAALAAAARSGSLRPADMQGATFTISSLGGIGATNFTPIINAPEVAILGLPRSEIQPIWDGDNFQPRRMQPLSLSFDHRVVDGVAAAHFLAHVAVVLKDFRRTSE